MIENTLNELLKEYVNIFINEYHEFLSPSDLDDLKSIDYHNIFMFKNTLYPFGEVEFGKIYVSNNTKKLMDSIQNMKEYNTKKYYIDNNNLSSYIKYMCENGYNFIDYFKDILMYFVFKIVIKEESGFINGLINQEVKFLSIKYSIKSSNLYAREEKIIEKVTRILKLSTIKRIIFMDKVTRFKYLNDNFGLRYAKLIEDVEELIDKEYQKINKNYDSVSDFLDYVNKYDHLLYGDVYNYILDFEVQNHYNYLN